MTFFPDGSQYFLFCFFSGSLMKCFLLFGIDVLSFQTFSSAA